MLTPCKIQVHSKKRVSGNRGVIIFVWLKKDKQHMMKAEKQPGKTLWPLAFSPLM